MRRLATVLNSAVVISLLVGTAGCTAPTDRSAALMAAVDRIFEANECAAPRFGPARELRAGGWAGKDKSVLNDDPTDDADRIHGFHRAPHAMS